MRFHEENHGIYFDDLDVFGVLHNARYPTHRANHRCILENGLGWTIGVGTKSRSVSLGWVNHFEYIRAVEGSMKFG